MRRERTVQFILNADLVQADLPPALSVLDYLRDHRRLTGTKEGCREGDCGACNVLVGELTGGRLSYRPMTSCLVPAGELEGKHLVTIEGLTGERLTAVQSALRDGGASQCGYCTPGFVVSLMAWVLDPSRSLDDDGLEDAISGNLCRCTGYRSIKQAARHIAAKVQSCGANEDRIELLCGHFGLPDYFTGIETRLMKLERQHVRTITPDVGGTIVAGATDLYLQRGMELDDMPVGFVNHHAGNGSVRVAGDELHVDSSMTFESFFNDPVMREIVPGLPQYRKQIASWPVRCRATLGGNLCNASPVADVGCLLLALEATIDLAGENGKRFMPLNELYLGYKQLNKSPDEMIEMIRIPVPAAQARINWIKVSKRFSLDIATLCSAIKIEHNEGLIARASLAFTGVSRIPLWLEKSSRFLEGRTINLQTVLEVAAMVQTEISPISDVRGSVMYRRLLARQMCIAHFLQQYPEYLDEASLYEALR